jgi:hypothetical protein
MGREECLMPSLVLEGTWEEVASRGEELAGKRVRVTVLDPQPAQLNGGGKMTADEWTAAADALAQEFGDIPPLPEEAFSRDSLYEGHF